MNWQYISGFFDADGSITLSNVHKGKHRTVVISFHNNDLNILKSIQSFIYNETGCKGYIISKCKTKEHHIQAYDLKYSYFPNCISLLHNIESRHTIKNRKINIALQLSTITPRNGKYSPSILAKREELIDLFFSLKL